MSIFATLDRFGGISGIPVFSISPDSGTDPVVPTAAGLVTIIGAGSVTTVGGTNTLTISSSGGGFIWVDVTGTSDTIEESNGYIANNAGLVILTLPLTCAVGDAFRVVGKGAGGWLIDQPGLNQKIKIGNATTTTGVGGSLASTNANDCVEILCTATDNDFLVISSMGNITVV